MKKEDNFSYKFVRNVFGPVWNFYYNAKVVGQENIPEEGSIVVVGNESKGIRKEIQEFADIKVKIPLLGKTESLNAGVAASIIAYEYVRKK